MRYEILLILVLFLGVYCDTLNSVTDTKQLEEIDNNEDGLDLSGYNIMSWLETLNIAFMGKGARSYRMFNLKHINY